MRSRRLLEGVAAILCAGAGVIHLRYGAVHAGQDSVHGLFFYGVGWLQLEATLLLLLVRRRPAALLWSVLAGNAAVVAIWAQTRFVGVPLGVGAGAREPVGLADLTATGLEVAIVLTLLPLVTGVRLAAFTERAISVRAGAMALTAVAITALPLTAVASVARPDAHHRGHDHGTEVAAGHLHGATGHGATGHAPASGGSHAEGHDAAIDGGHGSSADHAGNGHDAAAGHSVAAHVDGGHGHVATTGGGTTGHGHPGEPLPPGSPPHGHPGEPLPPGTPPHGHPPDDPSAPVVSLGDTRLTAAQQEAGLVLLGRTVTGMAPYRTIADAKAAGYESIGDRATGFIHFINWSYLADGFEFDPARIEAIVAQVNADGTATIVSALYILEPDKTMLDVPDIAGPLSAPYFHSHSDFCFAGHQLVGLAVSGQCPAGSTLFFTPPMIHVWLVARECGPFSTIEGHGVSDCYLHSH